MLLGTEVAQHASRLAVVLQLFLGETPWTLGSAVRGIVMSHPRGELLLVILRAGAREEAARS
ncbi:hypothetical protein GCM10009854_06370 [Saccharopolyspora halophila]|uniref:Uncharacterized protein n=1 Tax=Saccharopolyspora halophila TaxID=405551 RepID=A0ABN3FMZ1_9PSEU